MKIIKDLGSKLNQQGDINNALDIERESEESTLMKYPLLENQLSKASCALDYLKWSEVTQSCPTLCNPMDCSLPGSIHGIFQARILEWVAITFSRGSSRPRDRIRVSHIAGRRFTIWATREAIWSFVQNQIFSFQFIWIFLYFEKICKLF